MVCEPPCDVPEHLDPVWKCLHEDDSNLFKVLHRHLESVPVVLQTLLSQMAWESTWAVDKHNALEAKCKKRTKKQDDASSVLTCVSDMSSDTTSL